MRFGRKARTHDERIPKLSTLRRKSLIAPVVLPVAVDYTERMPNWTGMFGNDVLGDCTCAAVFHAFQVWSANANPPMDQDSTSMAIQLYSESCGYVPGDPDTDNGGIEQEVLAYWVNTGVARSEAVDRQKLSAFVEVDQRSLENIKTTIYEGGVCYIGFLVPAYFDFTRVWDLNPEGDNSIIAGHAVVLTGYDDTTGRFKLISWGMEYEMTYGFFQKFTDEAYFLANAEWFQLSGKTPLGMDLSDLEEEMAALKWQWASPRHTRRRRRHLKIRRRQNSQS
jgi:hypothetical protein